MKVRAKDEAKTGSFATCWPGGPWTRRRLRRQESTRKKERREGAAGRDTKADEVTKELSYLDARLVRSKNEKESEFPKTGKKKRSSFCISAVRKLRYG